MKDQLELVLALIADGHPVPVDLQTDLMAQGIDVEALIPDTAADTSLTIYTASGLAPEHDL